MRFLSRCAASAVVVFSLTQTVSANGSLERANMGGMESPRVQAACSIGCYRLLRLPPLPGGVDFCYIHNRDVGRCISVPDCEFTCR